MRCDTLLPRCSPNGGEKRSRLIGVMNKEQIGRWKKGGKATVIKSFTRWISVIVTVWVKFCHINVYWFGEGCDKLSQNSVSHKRCNRKSRHPLLPPSLQTELGKLPFHSVSVINRPFPSLPSLPKSESLSVPDDAIPPQNPPKTVVSCCTFTFAATDRRNALRK